MEPSLGTDPVVLPIGVIPRGLKDIDESMVEFLEGRPDVFIINGKPFTGPDELMKDEEGGEERPIPCFTEDIVRCV